MWQTTATVISGEDRSLWTGFFLRGYQSGPMLSRLSFRILYLRNMKQVLVFGNNGTASVLKHFFMQQAPQCQLTVINEFPADEPARKELIGEAALVISLGGAHHQAIAEECIACGTHFITPGRVNEKIMDLRSQIEQRNILFLYEMGFDPGLDHMSALHCINGIRAEGGDIRALHLHSGRLVAAEHDDNPWHHKTTDAQQLVHEGKEGAVYKDKGAVVQLKHEEIFDGARLVEFPGLGFLSWYPVADSMRYVPLYGLAGADTVIRTTLRHPDFIYGWKNVVDLRLTGEYPSYHTGGMSLADFFRLHFDRHGFSGWLEKKMMERFAQTKEILDKLMQFMEVEQEANELASEYPGNILMVDEKGKLENIDLEEVKDKAAAIVAYKMHEANLTLKQLFFLGMDDQETLIGQGMTNPANIMAMALEKKMSLQPGEHDMIVMLHEVEYALHGEKAVLTSSLLIKGNAEHTAADTVSGLILGVTAKLMMTGQISLKGLHIPVLPEIYEPVLKELNRNGIVFEEQRRLL